MFDDEKNSGQAPGNLPFAPEPARTGHSSADSFSPSPEHGPDALDAGLLKRKAVGADAQTLEDGSNSAFVSRAADHPPMAAMAYATKEPVLGKILAAFLSVVGIGVILVGGWYGYTNVVRPMLAAKKDVPASSVVQNSATSSVGAQVASDTPVIYRPTVSTSSIQAQINNDTLLSGEQPDTDHDGLPDRRERELGTNLQKADSDDDGLMDGDEILIWSTDPLNPDSDGDGFKDGREVTNGYNPLGPGKLFGAATSSPSSTLPSSTKTPSTVPTSSTTSPMTSNSLSNIPSL